MTLGDIIKRLRNEQGLTQPELAAKAQMLGKMPVLTSG